MPNGSEQCDSVAVVYAEALLPLAERAGQMVDVLAELTQAAELLDGEAGVMDWFINPLVSDERKIEAVEHAFRGRVSDLTCDVLGVIARHGRMSRLAMIVRAYQQNVLNAQNKVEVHVTTAVPLSEKSRAATKSALARRVKADVVLVEHVDTAVLGGMIVQIGDEMIDVSVQGELSQMNRTISRWMESMIARPADAPGLEADSE